MTIFRVASMVSRALNLASLRVAFVIGLLALDLGFVPGGGLLREFGDERHAHAQRALHLDRRAGQHRGDGAGAARLERRHQRDFAPDAAAPPQQTQADQRRDRGADAENEIHAVPPDADVHNSKSRAHVTCGSREPAMKKPPGAKPRG